MARLPSRGPTSLRSPARVDAAKVEAVNRISLPREKDKLVLGRDPACDVVLDFPMVSSRHVAIERQGEAWWVRDLGSTNGTFLRGRRIEQPVEVKAGDVIGLGSYQISFSADGSQLVEVDRRGEIGVEATRVSVMIDDATLLEDVSLVVRPGELIGLMGPSGAGKSTLLKTLVGSQPPASGRITVGGIDLYGHRAELRGQVGYVPQDEIMHGELTVEQALWFSARLRLPPDYADHEIRSRIAAVVQQLGLEGTEKIAIGPPGRPGVSGGQRKRVNVAMELITDPPVLVLDEPTSGLASTDALALVRMLRGLADRGKTIILTIHQPSLEILQLLHGVAVVGRDASTNRAGVLVWYGPAYPDAPSFFEPPSGTAGAVGGAESILRGLESRPAAEWRNAYRASGAHDAWMTGRLSGRSSSSRPPVDRSWGSPLTTLHQCWVLIKRMVAVKLADGWGLGILLAQAPLIALLIVGVLGRKTSAPLDAGSWPDVSAGIGMTTFLMALAAVWFGCSNAAREIVSERAIYRRERMVGLIPSAYLTSKVVVLALLAAVQCIVLLVGVRLGCGLTGGWAFSLLVLWLAAGAGTAVGLAISAAVRTPEAAAGALPLAILPLVVLGGSLLPITEMPDAVAWLADTMPSRWAFEGLIVNEAASRPILETPLPETPWNVRVSDIADPWFPAASLRSGRATPVVVLIGLWMLALVAAGFLLVAEEKRRR
jgi:ABC-type multidrug transport system ATPase subunit/ABC-type multidrug transport system permease subunit